MYRIGILSHGYPSPTLLYNYTFVHARAKLYHQFNNKVRVFTIGKIPKEYVFEGIRVWQGPVKSCRNKIKEFNPDILCVHSPATRELQYLTKYVPMDLDIPKIIWIHGYEALLFPKYYPIVFEPYLFSRWVYTSITSLHRLKEMRRLFQDSDKRGDYIVFVSKWMKKEAERSVGYPVKNYAIIPNPVDENLFTFKDRTKRWIDSPTKKAITLRSFSSKKYGVDIAIKAFAHTRSNCELHVYGKGRLAGWYRKLSKKVSSNSFIHEKYFPHNKLPQLYHQHDLFVSPSRTEAQGLAMCEFMATGAPVVATSVGGIPEFVRNGKEGFLVRKNDYKAIAEAVDILVEDESLYKKMSVNCRKRAENIFSGKTVARKELYLIKSVIEEQNN